MTILLAPDKFKGSRTAAEVCTALRRGIQATAPEATVLQKPMADGGDGSLDVLDHYFDLQTITRTVQDPLGRPIAARYKTRGTTAYIEMAAASGLVLLPPVERDCTKTSTHGTGELLVDALARGVTEVYLFIGGSATNDGGIGVAHALGYRFFDADEKLLVPTGENLQRIHRISEEQRSFDPGKVRVNVVCDVDNPLYGPNGAAQVYAAQKGATPGQIEQLDRGLRHFAQQLTAHGYPDVARTPGSGAAGGLGGGAVALLGAELVSGVQLFLELTQLAHAVATSDLIVTGEGKLDAQTARGKVVSGVCALARRHAKPVVAVCGDTELPGPNLGLERVFTVRERVKSTAAALERAEEVLEEIGREIGRAW